MYWVGCALIWKRKVDVGLRRRSDNRVDMVEKTFLKKVLQRDRYQSRNFEKTGQNNRGQNWASLKEVVPPKFAAKCKSCCDCYALHMGIYHMPACGDTMPHVKTVFL